MRVGLLAAALLVIGTSEASAEWQVKPFLGTSFGGTTTFVDVGDAAGDPTIFVGGNTVLLGEVFGLDADFGYGPGFFESEESHLVVSSSVTTLTGSLVVALPRRLAEAGLRPYFVVGGGLMHVRITHVFDVLQVANTLPAVNVGGGVTGF